MPPCPLSDLERACPSAIRMAAHGRVRPHGSADCASASGPQSTLRWARSGTSGFVGGDAQVCIGHRERNDGYGPCVLCVGDVQTPAVYRPPVGSRLPAFIKTLKLWNTKLSSRRVGIIRK